MPPVGFEPTTPVFERAKTVHALDSAATVIGSNIHNTSVNQRNYHSPNVTDERVKLQDRIR
jgi:hypothetical protein